MLAPTTRNSLLLRLRDPGDQDAWAEFVSVYEPAVYRWLRRNGLQDSDARDVLQELFVAVSKSMDRWQAGPQHGSFRGWLSTSIRSLMISWHRRRQSRPDIGRGIDLQLVEHDLAAASETDEGLDAEVFRAKFRYAAALVQADVKPVTWQMFWKVAVEGLSAVEVAKRMRVKEGAVRLAKCRVIARLKKVMTELENDSC